MEEASCVGTEETVKYEQSELQDKVESDETFDNPCQPCLSEDKQVESRKFCEDCQEFLCDACVEFHKKVTVTKQHKLVNIDQANIEAKQTLKSLSICYNHVGKRVGLICKDHKKIICQSCVNIEHASCDNIISVEEAATNVRESKIYIQTTSEITDTRKKIEDYIYKKENDNARVEADLNTALENLEKEKAKLVTIIDKLTSFDEEKIKQKFSVISKAIASDIKQCKGIVDSLTNAEEFLQSSNEDEISIFTHIRGFKQNVQSAKNCLLANESLTEPETIVFKTNDEVADKLRLFKRLGYLEREKRMYRKSSSKSSDSIQISKTGFFQNNKHDILSICILEEEYIVVTECESSCLKLINTTDKNVTNSLTFDSRPFDVCKLPKKKIAVTLLHGHQVKLVSYDFPTTLKTEGGFDTVEKCRGIEYFKGLLYVACGGGYNGNEGPGHIRVYTTEGELENTIISSTTGVSPVKMSGSFINAVYIADSTFGLFKINDDSIEETKHTTECESLALDEHGYIFVTSNDTNIIYQLTADGAIITNVLSEEDGLKNPQALAFDCKRNILYVAMKESSQIQMYFLDYQ